MDIIKKISKVYDVPLSETSVEKLSSIVEKREYRKDEIILKQGQVSLYFYIIEHGLIRQFYYKNGRDITEHISHEGDIAVCIESLFLNTPTNLLIEALEPSTIYLLKHSEWKRLCEQDEDINKLYISVLEYMLIVSQRKADSWRFESAHERYERFIKDYPEAAKRAPIAHIASYLLMNPETLSRVRGK